MESSNLIFSDSWRDNDYLIRRGFVSANIGIQDNQKLTNGAFERPDRMELLIQKRFQDVELDGFDFDVFPLTSILEFEEVNNKLKEIHAQKSFVKYFECFLLIKSFLTFLKYVSRTRNSEQLGDQMLGMLLEKFYKELSINPLENSEAGTERKEMLIWDLVFLEKQCSVKRL